MCRLMDSRHSDRTSSELYETIRMDNTGSVWFALSLSCSVTNRPLGVMMHVSPLLKIDCKASGSPNTATAFDSESGARNQHCQWADLTFIGLIDSGIDIGRND